MVLVLRICGVYNSGVNSSAILIVPTLLRESQTVPEALGFGNFEIEVEY
jgi:hypothetical protein